MNSLIYGKDPTEGITNISYKDGAIYVFSEYGESDPIEWKPWAISSKNIEGSTLLDGTQHYKYLHRFASLEEMQEKRNRIYELDMYTVWNMPEQFMLMEGVTYFKGMNIKDVSVLSFDIETDGLKHTDKSKVFMIGNTFRKGEETHKRLFDLKNYNGDCGALIDDWCSYVRQCNPSIMLGHNVYMYDLPYLQHVSNLYRTSLKLGRDGSDIRFEDKTSKFRKDGSQSYDYHKANIFGRDIIDTWMLSIQYDIGRSFISYGLKQIIKQLGLEKEGRTFVDASKISYYYENDEEMYSLACAYCDDDSEDSLKLFDIMAPAKFYFTQSVPKTFQEMGTSATGSQINNIMVRSYLQEGHSIAKGDGAVAFEGAHSLGIPGVYKNCVRWDVSSLYPSIMRQYKIYHTKKDPNKNFLNMVEFFTLERLKNKKLAKETGNQYFKDLEQSQKVAANSMYGFMGAPKLNYNYPFGAAEVTRYGRETLEKALYWASGKTVEVLNGTK